MVEQSDKFEKSLWGELSDVAFLYLERAAVLGAVTYAWKKTDAWELGVVSISGGLLMSLWISVGIYPAAIQGWEEQFARHMTTRWRERLIKAAIFIIANMGNYWIITKTGDLINRLAEGVG